MTILQVFILAQQLTGAAVWGVWAFFIILAVVRFLSRYSHG